MSSLDISGLELFQMPFGSNHVSRQPQASRQQHPTKAQSKASQQQSGRQPEVQQPVIQKPAEQAAKPTAAAVHKPDIAPPKRDMDENKHAKPEDGIKSNVQVQDCKTQEKQPAQELSQKEQHTANTIASPDHTEQKELVLDMSSGSAASGDGKSVNADDAAKRKAHEEAEAKRKAEWEAKQLAKKQAEEEAIQRIQSMSDADAICTSTRQICSDIERITRRSMKECVADHIQELCREDTDFARLTMHPRKSLINCFKFINRQAKEFIRREMADSDEKPENGIYGCDVPDGLVFDWAEDYYYDADAPEDRKKEEKFVPKPYVNAAPKAASKSKTTVNTDKSNKSASKNPESTGSYEQMSFV